jgi:hypothetical protein
MAEQSQQQVPGLPSEATRFPGNADRTIRLDVLPFGKVIARSVFTPNELIWMDAEVKRIAQNPVLWVSALMAHLEAHRVMRMDIGKLARGSVGVFGIRRGFPLRAVFVAKWNVYETLWRHYLAHKAELASQLQAHSYEAEVLGEKQVLRTGDLGHPGRVQQGCARPGKHRGDEDLPILR